MKGKLLLLALLVLGELGFQTTEACIPLAGFYVSILSGSEKFMQIHLSRFGASTEEVDAFEKLQGCYKEGGDHNILYNIKIVESMLLSPECLKYYGSYIVSKMVDQLTNIKALIG